MGARSLQKWAEPGSMPIGVGMAVAGHPSRRTVRADLPHTALQSVSHPLAAGLVRSAWAKADREISPCSAKKALGLPLSSFHPLHEGFQHAIGPDAVGFRAQSSPLLRPLPRFTHWRAALRHVVLALALHLPTPLRSAVVTRFVATMRVLTSPRLSFAHGGISVLI